MLLTFSILIFSFFVIEGFPAQETSIPPKPIIESGVYRQALDSYGNPVAYLEAADAPDGRKFVHAGEGVQFEIPKYASGITEIKKPDSNLLPPLAPPSKLFIPPVLDQNQYSIADSTIDSTSSTFSSAPATSFAERLNFNKNQDQKEVIQGNDFLISTENSLISQNISKNGTYSFPTNSESYSNFLNKDLLPPIETPINQIAAGQVQKAEANPPSFSSNPFLTKTAGLSAPKQQVSSGGISAFNINVKNDSYIKSNKNNHKFTGTFGGAPGFLGNQKPGYAIRPSSGSSGTLINPSPTPASGQSALNKQPTIDNRFAEKGNHPGKYSGGFGGPPGILAPYDNVKQ